MTIEPQDVALIYKHVKTEDAKRLLMSPSREDLRPQCYVVPPESPLTYRCAVCREKGVNADLRGQEAFILDGADAVCGDHIYLCHAHLPEDIVIYNPRTNKCSDRSGQNQWTEGGPVDGNELSGAGTPKGRIIH